MSYTILANGLGTNSTATLAGMYERGMSLDANIFANTADERPETYRHMEEVNRWCLSVGFPPVQVLNGSAPQQVKDGSLSAECLRLGVLPSKAYGFSSCSMKWKVEPQRKFLRQFAIDRGIDQQEITLLIGFDADEQSRVARGQAATNPTKQRYLLDEWGWGREECIDAIKRVGLSQPGKSACFMCPSSKKHEIILLRQTAPDLLERALEIERGAKESGKSQAAGLGRSFSWAEFLKEYDEAAAKGADFLEKQFDLFSSAGIPEADCACGAAA